MDIKQEASKVAEEIANETYRLVSGKLNLLNSVIERLKTLEDDFRDYTKNLELDETETERLISEKYTELLKQIDESSLPLIGDIQELKDEVQKLKIEINRLKTPKTESQSF